MAKKTFIIDTNVIIHDYNCLYSFEENDIGIPITVLEEIDNFKKGRDQLNFNAREFTRQIDNLFGSVDSNKNLVQKGISLGKNRGKVFIITDVSFNPEFSKYFMKHIEDNHILSGCFNFIKKHPEEEVVFITKDVNLRIKARALGIETNDYMKDKIQNVHELTSVVKIIENAPDEVINELYQNKKIEISTLAKINDNKVPMPNQYYIIRNSGKSSLARYDSFEQRVDLIEKVKAYGITPQNSEQAFAINALTDDHIKLVTITGTAGTGKTLLALAASLHNRAKYKQIYLSRPIVPLSNKDIGYLPGSAKNKIEPYMQPLYDNLKFIQNNYHEGSQLYNLIDELQKRDKLIISPLAYIRGRTLSDIYFIVDEAQNLTPHEVKTIITRAGKGTKIILTGDINQIDTPFLDSESNGLTYIIDKFKGEELYAHMTLEKGERSDLSELASKLL